MKERSKKCWLLGRVVVDAKAEGRRRNSIKTTTKGQGYTCMEHTCKDEKNLTQIKRSRKNSGAGKKGVTQHMPNYNFTQHKILIAHAIHKTKWTCIHLSTLKTLVSKMINNNGGCSGT